MDEKKQFNQRTADTSSSDTFTYSTSLECAEEGVTLSQPFLRFNSKEIEERYLKTVSKWRRPVLAAIMGFDLFCFFVRISWLVAGYVLFEGSAERLKEVLGQLWNLVLLYVLVGVISWRSKRMGFKAAQQEEILLAGAVALAICNLLFSLEGEKRDYVVACMFLISASTILKIRWWVGGAVFVACALFALYLDQVYSRLPSEALGHVLIAWMCGTMVGYQSDYGRREMFASKQRAEYAHRKEMEEAQARIQAQRELTEAHVLATEKSVLMAKEVAANEAKSEFMRVMCHEIRTPLNGCLASVEMLLETALREDQRELACIIRVCGKILLSTVSNFLDFFKLEAGGVLDLVETEVNLPHLMNEVRGIIQAMVAGHNRDIEIKQPILHSAPKVILGDADRLRGIILNLYSNAAKFTRKGSIEVSVEVTDRSTASDPGPGYNNVTLPPTQIPQTSSGPRDAQESLSGQFMRKRPSMGSLLELDSGRRASLDSSSGMAAGSAGQWLLFQVRDTGVGISGPGLKSLFKEYVQGSVEEMQRPRTNAGTGLGLSICLKQVGALGGRIGAYSKLGSGSVFWFTLPVKTLDMVKEKRRSMSWCGNDNNLIEMGKELQPESPRCWKYSMWMRKSNTQGIFPGPSGAVKREDVSIVMDAGSSDSRFCESEKENLQQESDLKGCQILLVEDNLMNQKVAQKMLQSFGAKCTIAANGLEAIDVLLGTGKNAKDVSDDFDLILMDMLMPKMGGLEATKILRERNVTLPIVALTANALESDYGDCRNAGMDGFLSKPVLKGDLKECLLSVLHGKKFPSQPSG